MNADIIILFGGTSSERLVSVASAQHLALIMPQASLWFWSATGSVVEVRSDELVHHQNAYVQEFSPKDARVIAPSIEGALNHVGDRVLYLALHGGDGENGWIQGKLEALQIKFTGSSAAASALAMNKSKAKDAVKSRGILTASQYLYTAADKDALNGLIAFQGSFGQIVIKPACDGSSAGLAFIKTKDDCTAWFDKNKSSTELWLAEERLDGSRIDCGCHHAWGVFDGPAALGGDSGA